MPYGIRGSNVKVLHCIPTFGGGGAERQLAYLAPALCKLGAEVDILYLNGGPNLSRFDRSGVTLHQIRSLGNHDPRLLYRLLVLAHSIRPDIIQTWIPQMDILGALIARILRIPHVMTERCSYEAYASSWKDFARYHLGRHVAAVVANSDWGKCYWNKLRPQRLTAVIRNGVPVNEILSAEPKRTGFDDVAPECKVILAAGRYTAQKNFFILLDALEEVLAGVPDAIAVLYGEGPLQETITQQVRMHPYGNCIRVLGWANDLWGVLKSADVFVSPSLFEGSPNTVLEAMAAGCPLVVSNIPPHRELLDEESALFSDPVNPHDVATAILSVLRDPVAAARRADIAAQRVVQFSVEQSAARYMEIYRHLIGSSVFCHANETRSNSIF